MNTYKRTVRFRYLSEKKRIRAYKYEKKMFMILVYQKKRKEKKFEYLDNERNDSE